MHSEERPHTSYILAYVGPKTILVQRHALPMVDLSLASSYVPAFVCVTKSLLGAALCIFLVPHGGLVVLCMALLLDRVFLNNDFILDVNAAVAAVLWSEVANHERTAHGIHTPGAVALGAAWATLAVAQLVRPGLLKSKVELYVYACLACCMSVTYCPYESIPYRIARIVGYDVAALVQIYWQISSGQEEPLVVTLLRHGAVLVAHPLVALAAACTPTVVVALRWRPPPPAPGEDPDVEAAALREALASRKEKAGN